MKWIYLTFSSPTKKNGLFYSTHERIKHAIPFLENYKILNIQFYDNRFLVFLKTIFGIQPRHIGESYYIFNDLKYENIWIKRGIFSAVTPWGKFDKLRISKLLCNEHNISTRKLKTIIKEARQYDIIMAHWGYPNGKIAMNVSNAIKIPFYVTYHGSDINVLPFKNIIINHSIKKILKNATINLMVSRSLSNQARELVRNIKVHLSPNGISSSIIKNKKPKIHENNINILFIGNLNDDKRADKLPEIIKAISLNTKLKLSFSIVGEGVYKDLIDRELNESNISFELTGQLPHEAVIEYLEKAKILILPSRREGLPLVILEAIATGTIPIASNVGGIGEILEHKFLIDESESFVNDFANKVVQLIERPVYPQLKIEDYTWGNIIKKEIEFIKSTNFFQ